MAFVQFIPLPLGKDWIECKQYQGLEILPIPIFCRSDIADNRQTSDHRPIEQYLPIGQCICRYAHYLPIVNAFADTYADIYRQIFFSYRQIFLSIGRYRVYLPIQGPSADSRLISTIGTEFIGISIYRYRQIFLADIYIICTLGLDIPS